VQLTREVAVQVDTRIETFFRGNFGTTVLVPVGVTLGVTPIPRLDVGVRFAFANLLGDHGSADARAGELLVAFRF
jgi:hypothetical protein